jgi:hypothetical protein
VILWLHELSSSADGQSLTSDQNIHGAQNMSIDELRNELNVVNEELRTAKKGERSGFSRLPLRYALFIEKRELETAIERAEQGA